MIGNGAHGPRSSIANTFLSVVTYPLNVSFECVSPRFARFALMVFRLAIVEVQRAYSHRTRWAVCGSRSTTFTRETSSSQMG